MIDRRQLLTASAIGAAFMSLSATSLLGQGIPTVREVLFDPDIPALGNPDGDVTIAEFFDYQCPYCKRGHSDLLRVVEQDRNVRLVMKDWPIFGGPSVHAASLVLAAHNTGKYKEAMDALMATPARLKKEEVDEALAKGGLDPKALLTEFRKDAHRIDAIIGRNMAQANAFNLGGTPVFIIGTKIYKGAMTTATLIEAIEEARAA